MGTNNQRIIDYMARDYDSLLEAMRQRIPEQLPEWSDFEQESDFGNTLLQLFAHMGDVLSYYQDRIANESFLGTAQERRSVIQHLRLIGYQLATAAPASAPLRIEFPADCHEVVRLSRGDAFATKSSDEQASVRFEYNGPDMDIDCASLAVNAETGRKHYLIDVEEGRLIVDDLIGVSDGTDDQRFPLSHTGLILRSTSSADGANRDIALYTELGGVVTADWRLQQTLAFSLSDARDYTLELDENDQATVVFGGRGFGAVVPSGAAIKVTYRVGGGRHGNVSAGKINTIADAPALNLVGARVRNLKAASGGSARESIERAADHAPGVFRSQNRAVTAGDYKTLALNFNGVGKVRAEVRHWNRVTLYVAPQGGGYVSDTLTADLLAYFEDRRPLSTLIDIADVDYVRIYISARVGIDSYYSRIEKRRDIEAAVAGLLAFDAVDFAEAIYLSKFYEAIEALPGVTYVTIDEFRREGRPGPEDDVGKIKLRPSELPRLPGSDPEDPADDQPYAPGVRILALEGGY